jgi:fermentation-respiration switch protein FrsA (DUF1100 family)
MKSLRLSLAGLMLASAAAAQRPESATFYLVVGAETLTVERMTRTPSRLTFQLFNLKSAGRIDFDGSVTLAGLVDAADVRFFASNRDTAPAMKAGVRFLGDSAGVETGGKTNWLQVGSGVLPNVNPSFALLEQTLLRARAMGGPSVTLSYLYLPSGPASPVTVTWQGTDSAVVSFAGVTARVAVSPTGRLAGGIVPAQNARIIRGGETSGSTPGRKTYEPPAGAPYSAQEVVVRTKQGLSLAGTLTLPPGAQRGRVPAVITITGSGSQDRDETAPGMPDYQPFRQRADTLGRRGIAVLRLDDRGIGGSDRGPAGATTADFANDIRGAVEYLRQRSDIDPSQIVLAGHSEGGTIAPMVAATDSAIAAVVIMGGGVSPGRELLTFQQRFVVDSMARLVGQQRDAALAQYARTTDSLARALPWMKFFLEYDGSAAAGRIRSPVLIVHGAKDYQVPVGEAERTAAAVRAGGNRDVTVRVFPATNHLFVDDAGVGFSYEKLPSYRVRPEVLGTLADWLTARLKP